MSEAPTANPARQAQHGTEAEHKRLCMWAGKLNEQTRQIRAVGFQWKKKMEYARARKDSAAEEKASIHIALVVKYFMDLKDEGEAYNEALAAFQAFRERKMEREAQRAAALEAQRDVAAEAQRHVVVNAQQNAVLGLGQQAGQPPPRDQLQELALLLAPERTQPRSFSQPSRFTL